MNVPERLVKLFSRVAPAACLFAGTIVLAAGQDQESRDPNPPKPAIPEDLIDDDHYREEFGVNEFTTPSIKKLFEQLEGFGKVPFELVERPVSDSPPGDRMEMALSLGRLIAEGFLAVTDEEILQIEAVGRAILKHAKGLGAELRIKSHAQSILEKSGLGEWDALKDELAATQAEVEVEMLTLRDVDLAHLIALGGWIRAFEIATVAAGNPYSPERTTSLARADIAEYFLMSLDGLHPKLQEREIVVKLRTGLTELRNMIDVPEGKSFTAEELARLNAKAVELVESIPGTKAKAG